LQERPIILSILLTKASPYWIYVFIDSLKKTLDQREREREGEREIEREREGEREREREKEGERV